MVKSKKTFFKFLSLVICGLAIGIPLLIGYLNGIKYDKAIRKNPTIALGTIYSYEHKYKLSPVLKYVFEFKGSKYSSSSSNSGSSFGLWQDPYKKLFPHINGKTFPVFLSEDAPATYNKILVTPDDFKELDMGYPDSLIWVKRFLEQ